MSADGLERFVEKTSLHLMVAVYVAIIVGTLTAFSKALRWSWRWVESKRRESPVKNERA